MLEARSVALVGASARVGSFGRRMFDEVCKSQASPRIYPVNPRYAELDGRRCYPTLGDLPETPELTLLAVPDAALEQQFSLAASVGSRGAVIFGNAYEQPAAAGSGPGLRQRLAAIADTAGLALCGAGCMGFVNVSQGLRAIGYTEPDPLPAGPVALITHSGSVFSAMLRARRGFGFTLALSSGQELVTAAPAYLEYALTLPGTRLLALVLEAIRDGGALRQVLAAAAARDIPVVLLTVGSSAAGRQLVTAHSGALAGADGGWEALARAYGLHRVSDLAEFTDTVELFAMGRRVRAGATCGHAPDRAGRRGLATVHDSGLERAHVADLAQLVGVPFASIGPGTVARLDELLDPGLVPANPLDVWGTGAATRELFAGSLMALADDPAVDAVALAVGLVPELDLDQATRSGLLALRHLLDHGERVVAAADPLPADSGRRVVAAADPLPADSSRRTRGAALLASGQASGAALLSLLADYGIKVTQSLPASDAAGTLAAAEQVGYPIVLKTDERRFQHKSDVGGVLMGIGDARQLTAAYADLADRLGPRVLVSQTAPPGVELALGIVTDPELGPLLVVGAGGVLVELLADRVVALPPVDTALARELVDGLRVSKLLAGVRGAPSADLDAVTSAIAGLSALALELGSELAALDVNPLICGPAGAIAVDGLAIARSPA